MIHLALLVVFCVSETSATNTGRFYDRQKETRALSILKNRFDLDKPRQGRMPLDCLNKCDDPACRAVNVFINGTCEVLLSPVFGFDCFEDSTAYIGSYETCPADFGHTFHSIGKPSCYKFVLEKGRSWKDARAHCVSLGGDLVAIETEAEFNHHDKVVRSNNSLLNQYFWSSGTDEDVEGEWRWESTGARVDGSLPGEYHVTGGSDYNCLYLYWSTTNSFWPDHPCTSSSYPLCEISLG